MLVFDENSAFICSHPKLSSATASCSSVASVNNTATFKSNILSIRGEEEEKLALSPYYPKRPCSFVRIVFVFDVACVFKTHSAEMSLLSIHSWLIG